MGKVIFNGSGYENASTLPIDNPNLTANWNLRPVVVHVFKSSLECITSINRVIYFVKTISKAIEMAENNKKTVRGMATILAIGTAVPRNFMYQSDFPDYYFQIHKCDHLTELKQKFTRICNR